MGSGDVSAAREQVRETSPAPPPRGARARCAFCGREGTTQFEHCPHCGQSYFERSRRG